MWIIATGADLNATPRFSLFLGAKRDSVYYAVRIVTVSMKRLLILAISSLAFLFPSSAHAQDGVHIASVGLTGYYTTGLSTPVRVHIPALSSSQIVSLEFDIETRTGPDDSVVTDTGHYSAQVNPLPNEPFDTGIPILLTGYGQFTIRLSAKDAFGNSIGESVWKLNPRMATGIYSALVAIYCVSDATCQQAHAQLPIRGSQQQRTEDGDVDRVSPPAYAILGEAAEEDWAYGAADAIIISAPLAGLAPLQRTAFEGYLRGGGTLVLLEEEAADPNFLAPYRSGSSLGTRIPVGRGELIRLQSLRGQSLANYVKQHSLKRSESNYAGQFNSSRVGSGLLERLGVNFTFPRLRWMLLWFGAYILIAGLVNFTVLRRLGKLEWGWVTTGLASFAFAAALFAYSSSHRPANFMLDDVAVYWMDSRSPVAAADYGLRISAPERAELAVSAPGDALLQLPDGDARLFGDSSAIAEIGADFTGNVPNREGWRIELGQHLVFHPSLLRWSFQDFSLRGVRQFPGTVHWTSPGHLKNDTGLTFREAVVLDRKQNKRYRIASLGQGEEVDLSSIQSAHVNGPARRLEHLSPAEQFQLMKNSNTGLFSLDELPASYLNRWPANLTFIGIADAPVLQVAVEGRTVVRHNFAFAVVGLDEP